MTFTVSTLLLSQGCKIDEMGMKSNLKITKGMADKNEEIPNKEDDDVEDEVVIAKTITITSASISSGRLNIDGTNLDAISNVRSISANLSGYTMVVESKSPSRAVIRLTHSVNSTLAIAVSTLLVFAVDTASASTTVNLTINDGIPAGSVVAMNSNVCPAGWSNFNSANGRVVVGAGGSGNTDGEANALTSRAFGATGGTEFPVLPASTENGSTITPAPNFVMAVGVFGRDSILNYVEKASADTTLGGSTNALTEGNMQPYIVLRYCVKN